MASAIFTGMYGIGVATIDATGQVGNATWLASGDFFNPRVGDLDGDGAKDIAVVEISAGNLVVFWNDGHGVFSYTSVIPLTLSHRTLQSVI